MDAATMAIAIDLVGWIGWAVLTRLIARDGAGNRWITVDYYVSTALLAASTLCTVGGMFLTDAVLVTRVAGALGLVALIVLVVRKWRAVRRGPLTSVTAAPEAGELPPRPERTPRRRAEGGWLSVTVREIENMEVTF